MKDKKNARMAEKKSITQGASTYGTVSKSNSNDNSFEEDDAYDPYAMRSSGIGRGSNNGSPSTKYGGDAHDDSTNKTFPFRRRRLVDNLSKWRLNAKNKRSERSALANFVIDWTLPIFACYIGISVVILMTDPNEPAFSGSFVKAFYFVAVTIMAIGYGDYYPVSDGGKIYIMVLIFTGIVIVASVFDRLTMWFLVKAKDVRGKLEEKRSREIEEDLVTLREAIVSSHKMKGTEEYEPNLLQKGSHEKSTQKVNEDIQSMRTIPKKSW